MIIRTYKQINQPSLVHAMRVAKSKRGFVIIKDGILAVKVRG